MVVLGDVGLGISLGAVFIFRQRLEDKSPLPNSIFTGIKYIRFSFIS